MIILTTSTNFHVSLAKPSIEERGLRFVHYATEVLQDRIAEIRHLLLSGGQGVVVVDSEPRYVNRICADLLHGQTPLTRWPANQQPDANGVYLTPLVTSHTKPKQRVRAWPREALTTDLIILCGTEAAACYNHIQINGLQLNTAGLNGA